MRTACLLTSEPRMLGANGEPDPSLFEADNLHMNEKGYAIWNELVGHT